MQKRKKFQKNSSQIISLEGNEEEGIIIAHFGATTEVETSKGEVIRCHLRKNFEPTMTGDRVLWRLQQDKSGLIVQLLPRTTLLARPENSKRTKLIAANIDLIVIVTAPPPVLSFRLIDRYIVAAENLQIPPVILLNKIDLLNETEFSEIKHNLEQYKKIGYPVIFSSVYEKNGLAALSGTLKNKTCVLVGVSGVGKSSIIRALTGVTDIMIGQSSQSHLGKHTTTTSRLYHIPASGSIIDSPGVREFALWHLDKNQILKGFVDFQPFLGNCKFRNCEHQSEPGCALKQAVLENQIHPERWKSFQEIWDEV